MPKKTTRRAAKPAPRLPEDFEELLGAFEREGVEYLIVRETRPSQDSR